MSRSRYRGRSPCPRTRRLTLEQLEGRRLLAADQTWDGAPNGGGASADNHWRTGSNWRSDIVFNQPVLSLEFPAGAANLTNLNDFGAGAYFGSILMSGSGYTLQGNAITMGTGITSTIAAGTSNTISLPIALTSDQTWTSTTAGSTLNMSGGAIDLRGFNLTVNGSGTTILGPITDSTDAGGNNGVTAEGGTVVLTADNSTTPIFAGVHDGTLQVLGSVPQTVIYMNGGTLTTDAAATTGPINVTGVNGGRVAPGGLGTTGILSTQGDFVMSGIGSFGNSLAIDLNGTAVGSGYDALHVTGTATLGGLLNPNVGFASTTGSSYTILTATGGVSGTFIGLNDLDKFTANGRTFQIDYTPTSVVLTDVTVEITVNVGTDEADANTGDSLCDTNLAAPGLQCSLRAAIQLANASVDSNVIRFNFQGDGVVTINPTSELPTITNPVTIDGYTQPGASPNTSTSGFNGKLLVELSGTLAGDVSALSIAADDTTVRGLVINSFSGGFGAIVAGQVVNLHIEGNLIGTNATGTTAIPNQAGIAFGDVVSGSIGGTSPAARNVISGNVLDAIDAYPNQVLASSTLSIQGNFIGTAADGVNPLGNGRHGIFLMNPSSGTTIGGPASGAGNRIAFNTGTGVLLQSGVTSTSILSNAIFGNGALGIDLNQNGATTNDAGDADGGANNLQNYPAISYATRDAGKLKVTYNVPSDAANSTYPMRVEFFLADADGQEGQTFLGFDTLTQAQHEAGGTTITFATASPIKVFDKIVATATDSLSVDGAPANTSEFSPSVKIVSPWQNPGHLRWDVNDDTHVAADDVLDVINHINAVGSGKVPDNAANQKPFYDVDGDNNVVAADVLDVINYINAGKRLGGEAEAAEPAASGQSPAASDQSAAINDAMALLAADVAAQAARKRRN
jgi:CSLREA domain-containing protein